MRARPNQGGSIQFRGQTINYAPSPGQNLDPNRPGSGGTITKGGVTRSYAGGYAPMQMNSMYDETDDRNAANAARAARPIAAARPSAPRPIAPVARAPRVEDMAGMSDLGRESYLANNGIYAPGSVGAMNAQANGTGYNPPQQTERANPLSGDNNRPMEGQTTAIARPPFIQRGAGIPGGQDASPVRQTISQDDDIATSMQGTMDRLRPSVSGADVGSGRYARRFGAPAAQNAYDSLLKRILKPTS